MQFIVDNYEDIKKYYLGTFIKVKDHGDTLLRIDRVERTRVTGEVEDGREFVLYMNNNDPYEIDYVLPHKSCFQYGEDACQLFRVPARQYRRGLCKDNTRVERISAKGQVEVLDEFDFKVLKAFVCKQPFLSLSSAVKNEANNRSSVLSRRMAYHVATRGIFIDNRKVAAVSADHTIHMILPVFRKEIEDLVKDDSSFKVK